MFINGAVIISLVISWTVEAFPIAPSTSALIVRARGAAAFNDKSIADETRIAGRLLRASRRGEDTAWSATHPGLKDNIDAAITQSAKLPHYFWSGRTLPALTEEDGVKLRAMEIAQRHGGTTLELAVEGAGLPPFDSDDPDRKEIWQYASDAYAAATRGDAYFVRGEELRSGNVWEVYEYPQLKRSANVKRIFQILVHKLSEDPAHQIWPEVSGCDGVFLLDGTINCPAGAKLYYGSVKKPVITAETTVEKDATVKVSTTGTFPGVTRECMEILSGEFVSEVFSTSGVCDAATSKGDNGKVMTKVKQLLESTKNRNYLQQQRLFKTAAKVVGKPLIGALTSSLLDSLVAIDYYQKTGAETSALAKQIDDMVKAATGTAPGLAAAWSAKTAAVGATRAALVAELQKEIARKVKQAQETARRTEDCDKPPSRRARMLRRHLSTTLSMAPSSLRTRRGPKAPRSGAKAPPAPSCPAPGQKGKKVVPRARVRTKPAPSTQPKVAKLTPKPKPPARKTTVKRPANRPRRQPGKAAPPRKRITPKKKPRKVQKPAKKPRGTARPRRR